MIKRKPKIDPLELKAEKFLSKSWVIIRRESKRLTNYLFFYKPDNKMDGLRHIIEVIAYIILGIALARK